MSQLFAALCGFNPQQIRHHFECVAAYYDTAAVLQYEVGQRLLERLDWVTLQPKKVVDLGCGTGVMTQALLKRYPKAQVIGLDLAYQMVQKTRRRRHYLRHPVGICADVGALPLRPQSVELLISNLLLHWCDDLVPVLQQCAAALQQNGLFTFTTLGPDTLKELRAAWQAIDNTPVNPFHDMHDIGDALLQAGFCDPVVDMEMITLTYTQPQGLLRDLTAVGDSHLNLDETHLQALYQAYESFRQADGCLPATYEVIYGHAWVPAAPARNKLASFIPINVLV